MLYSYIVLIYNWNISGTHLPIFASHIEIGIVITNYIALTIALSLAVARHVVRVDTWLCEPIKYQGYADFMVQGNVFY